MTMAGVFKLNKDLMEENAESLKKLYEINSQYFSECVVLAQTAQGKLVEVKTAAGLMELQREYNKGLWEATKTNYQANSDVMKDSYKTAGDSMKEVFESMKAMMPMFSTKEEPEPKKTAKAAD
mgnify:FL=1